ncbi:MAG TPA: 4Fe-4S binding protein [Methanoregulaceae archaeon]|nr:4Fe-4S binding protein [Methanoregulaceae archaeon]
MEHSLKRAIRNRCADLDIPLVGFASAERWDKPPYKPWVPKEFRPESIIPGTKTVIVIGLPVFLPVIETAPSIYYHELYKTVNGLLDSDAYRIALFLNKKGFCSVPIPRDGYGSIGILKENPFVFFSHRHAAYLAGLGNFGVNNTILTREFGPRVRFASVFTNAGIPPDPIINESLCIHCMKCVEICPVHALSGNDYPDDITDKIRCATRSEDLFKKFISPCGFCIKVCPVGRDRELYGRKDIGIYNENDPGFDKFHKAWQHIRSFGSGKEISDK